MPLLTLACSGSAFMRDRMATVNHLCVASPLVRFKTKTLQHGAQALLSGTSNVRELGSGNEIGDEYPGLAQMVGADRPNSGGAK
jgi:hypothetical protein